MKKIRILVVNPYHPTPVLMDPAISRCTGIERKAGERLPPIGLAYITSKLRSAGHKTKLIDCSIAHLRPENLAGILKKQKPDLVISTTSEKTAGSDIRYLASAKESGASTALCGSYPTVDSRYLLGLEEVDFVIRGEPEISIEELANALEGRGDAERVKGVSLKKNGRIIPAKNRPLIENLDDLPFPAREDLPNEKYSTPYAKRNPQTMMISSRGCAYGCVFCTSHILYGRRHRSRTAKNVADEMEEVQKEFGVSDFSFQDDTFTLERKRALEICEEIKNRGLDVAWQCTTRVDCVDRELLAKMKKSGCYLIKYGVESGDESILQKMKKNISMHTIHRAINETRTAGIKTGASYIIGTPWENRRSLRRTIELSARLGTDYATFNLFTRFKGSKKIEGACKLGEKEIRAGLAKAYANYYLRPSQMKKHIASPMQSMKAVASIGRFLYQKWTK